MSVQILTGDCREVLRRLPEESVHCVVTSPPYWGLRDYNVAGQLGLEETLGEHIEVMVEVFREVRRVLRKDGTVWLNYGDCYATAPNGRSAADTKAAGNDDRTFRDKPFSTVGPIYSKSRRMPRGSGRWGGGNNSDPTLKPKDLCMVPNRLAIALQDDGWWVRSEIIWHKPNPMPESITDRPTSSHEKIYLLARSERYYFDADAVRESDLGTDHARNVLHKPEPSGGILPPHTGIRRADGRNGAGRNIRNVWTVATAPFPGAHFATFPPALIEPCIKAGTSEKGCCPECGAPWVREIKSRQEQLQATNNPGKQDEVTNWDRTKWPRTRKVSETIGWRPSCACCSHIEQPHESATLLQYVAYEPIPCTVLDPFAGAGTTGLVADRLKRNAILIELNEKYAVMAKRRIESDGGLFAEVELIQNGQNRQLPVLRQTMASCHGDSAPSPLREAGDANE